MTKNYWTVKNLIIYTFCAMALLACASKQNKSGDTVSSDTIESKDTAEIEQTISAYQIFKIISPEDAEKNKDYDTVGNTFVYADINWEEYGAKHFIVRCFKHDNGGTFVVYQSIIFEDEYGCNTHVDFLKFYLYNDGQLTELKDIIPEVTFDDFAQADGLTFYNPDQKVKDVFAQKDFRHEFDRFDNIMETSVCVFNSDVSFCYKWNGSNLVLDRTEAYHDFIHYAGLANVLLGDNPPEEIIGFQKKVVGKTVSFYRDGEKSFELSLNYDDKIDTIIVFSPLYSICFDHCENSGMGVGYNADYCFGDYDEFVFKDGVWIRRFTRSHAYWEGIMDSVPQSEIPGIIDFYTTKDAITNIYPENGKVVKLRDDPKFNKNATVTLIKIYRAQPNTDDDEDMDLEAELEMLDRVGDMTDIWQQFAEGQYDAAEPQFDGNFVDYYEESRDEGYSTRIVLAGFVNAEWVKVFCVLDHTGDGDTRNELTEYDYKNGKLTETELQAELKNYAGDYSVKFEGDVLEFSGNGNTVKFFWNGSKMEKSE